MVLLQPTTLSCFNLIFLGDLSGLPNELLLVVLKTRRKLRGDQALAAAAAAPVLWNELPLHIRQVSSLSLFKSLLKTHLFSLAFDTV